MSETIYELSAKITADAKELDKALKQSEKDVKEFGKASDKTFKEVGKDFQQLGKTFALVGGAITASLGLMIRSFVQTGSELHDLSLKTDISVESLAGLKYAAEQNGASLGTVEMAIRRTSTALQDAKDGLKESIRAFDRMGISISDLEGLNTEQQFLKIAYAIASIPDPMMRSATAIDLFGRSGMDMLPMLSQGEEGIKKLMDRGLELSGITTEMADKANKLGDAFNDLTTAAGGLWNQLASALQPAMIGLTNALISVTSGFSNFSKENQGLTTLLANFTAGLGGALTIMGSLTWMLPKLIDLFGKLGLSFGKGALAVAGLTTGLSMLGGGLLSLLSAKGATDQYNDSIRKLNETTKGLSEGTITLAEYNKALLETIIMAESFVAVGQSVNGLTAEQIATEIEWIETARKAYEQNKALIESQNGMADATKNINETIGETAISLEKLIEDTIKLNEATFNQNQRRKDWAEINERINAHLEYQRWLNEEIIAQEQRKFDLMSQQANIEWRTFQATMNEVTTPIQPWQTNPLSQWMYSFYGGLPKFATGGIVDAPLGQSQLAVVHGGEEIIPANSANNINIYVKGSVISQKELGKLTHRYLYKNKKHNYTTEIT